MARGWESKSIEDQQAQAAEKTSNPKPHLTPAQAARQRQKDGLLLSRKRVLQQIETSADGRRRDMLQEALSALNQQLADLTD